MEGQYIIVIPFNELLFQTSLGAHMVKHLPAMRETRVRSLDGEDPLEQEMETLSSTLAWKNPMDRGAW